MLNIRPIHDGFVFLRVEGREFNALGEVTSLGADHVTYEFIYDGKHHPGKVVVDIFSTFTDTCLTSIPCSLVRESTSQQVSALSTLFIKSCELKLETLTEDQKEELDSLRQTWDEVMGGVPIEC